MSQLDTDTDTDVLRSRFGEATPQVDKRRRRVKRWFMRGAALLAIASALFFAFAFEPDRGLGVLERRWAGSPSQWQMLDIAATPSAPATTATVHFRDTGPRNDREPIVLLHGTSASLHTWDGWAQALEGRRRVIRLDLPGYGLTGPFADHNYSAERYSATLTALAQALKLPPHVVVGNSLGGFIAWNYAVMQPKQVTKLLLIAGVGYPVVDREMPLGFKLANIPVLREVVRHMLPRSLIEASLKNVYGNPALVSEALIDRYHELTLRAGNRQALIKSFDQRRQDMAGADPSVRIKSIKQPTMLMWGAQDRLVPISQAKLFQADMPQARLVVLEGLGHVPMEEDPVQSLAAARAFLGR